MSEHQTLIREAPLELSAEGDGRTIDARIIPYGVTATICDPPDYVVEQEQFAPGALASQLRAAHRVKVWLSTMHEQGLRGIVGHGETIEERDDGVYATFRVHENQDGDKALQLVRDGLLPALSVEFLDLKSLRKPGGIVERVRAHLERVSLVPVGAYAGAEVLAMRAAAIEAHEQESAPEPIMPRLGSLPESLAYDLAARGFTLQATDTE